MDIKIRRVYRPIALADYFGEGDDVIEVWSNPPRYIRAEWDQIKRESIAVTDRLYELSKNPEKTSEEEKTEWVEKMTEANNRFYEWFSKVWKFDGKEVSTEEIREFAIKCEEEDEALWVWLITRTWEVINERRVRVKKERPTSSSS